MVVTLRDIAQAVGKSVSTVSSALNGYDDISQKIRELVRRVAREMSYTPNIVAQRLRKKRTDTLGFILPTFDPRFSNLFSSELLVSMSNESSAPVSRPSLTTVHQPIYSIGCMSCDVLTKCHVSTANPWQNVTCSCSLPWSPVVPSAAEADTILTGDRVVFSQQMRVLI